MTKENPFWQTIPFADKDSARQALRAQRDAISLERKMEANRCLLKELLQKMNVFGPVLSFCSFGSEINTWDLNAILSKQKKLLLPKIQNNTLQTYQVHDLSSQLIQNKWGLWEPNPAKCAPVDNDAIECILVPGLGFDEHHIRLGYGKGHYDRFLSNLNAKTIGLGYKEQWCPFPLPHATHDVPLDSLALY